MLPVHTVPKRRQVTRVLSILLACTALLAAAIFLGVANGSTRIPLSNVREALVHFNAENRQHLVIVDLRLPRVLASALVGAALSVAGAVMQGTTRNPMADSGLMGLSAGAGFALAICFAFFPGLPYLAVVAVSFGGAALGSALVQGIAAVRRGGATPTRLVLAGAAVSFMLAAFSQGVALVFHVAQNVLFWTAGGVAGCGWHQLRLIAPLMLAALLGACLLARRVSLLNLGEDVARGLGLNINLTRLLCNVVVLLLAGTAVAVVGPVSFVGLMIPHLARFLMGADYRRILPVSALLGALLVVTADLVARTIHPPFEAPLGTVVALVGVPFLLYLARKQRQTA